MKYFPFFVNLSKKNVLLIGGGDIAERKVDLLIKVNAKITLVAPNFTDYIQDLAKQKNVTLINEKYSGKFLDPEKFQFIIVATDD